MQIAEMTPIMLPRGLKAKGQKLYSWGSRGAGREQAATGVDWQSDFTKRDVFLYPQLLRV